MNNIDKLIKKLTPKHYEIDEKDKNINLTDSGIDSVESKLSKMKLLQGSNFYDPSNLSLVHHVNQSLKANILFIKDKDYILRDNQVQIIDEFTGRVLEGRRYGDGLHQAIEAKEGVPIQSENQTFASTTYQNYFRLYKKLAGMTGTAITEAEEFYDIYRLDVVEVPTNVVMSRKDLNDQIFRTEKEKLNAIVQDIKEARNSKQPVLVGTTSIEKSEKISNILKQEGIKHSVLNAKQHEKEAEIIQLAGCPESVTIATNMAGRGTDIVLGGKKEDQTDIDWKENNSRVLDAGGLHILGTERHESRRIDNQLRGRSGRQGDAGSSRFYLSLEDSLLRIFASDRVAAIMERLKLPEGEAIEHPWVTKAIENAQRKVEGRNFDIRKQLLEFDDVANEQRKVIYEQRNALLASIDTVDMVSGMRDGAIEDLVDSYIPQGSLEEQWDVPGLEAALLTEYTLETDVGNIMDQATELEAQNLVDEIKGRAQTFYDGKMTDAPTEAVQQYERSVMLQSIDSHWRDHLAALDHLRQ